MYIAPWAGSTIRTQHGHGADESDAVAAHRSPLFLRILRRPCASSLEAYCADASLQARKERDLQLRE